MYNLPYYKEKDPQVLVDFMKQHSFAMLIGSANDIPAATQIPFLVEEREGKVFLKGHFMRNTDHHKAFEKNANALCIFTGAHSYVSSSWYTDPSSGSTWNYMSIHARGKMNFLDTEGLIQILEGLTNHYEGYDSIASFQHISKEYIDRMVKAIIGFEIEVIEMDNVFKLSQNRDEKSYDTIVNQLKNREGDAKEIGELMEKRKPNVFPS
jgi:transcriptional regulator